MLGNNDGSLDGTELGNKLGNIDGLDDVIALGSNDGSMLEGNIVGKFDGNMGTMVLVQTSSLLN